MVPWAQKSATQGKRHLGRLSRFCRAHERDQQTGTQTDRETTLLSVLCSNRPHLAIAAMRPNTNLSLATLTENLSY